MAFTIVDFNNFWSPSGGGVRRYHLEKMNYYKRQSADLLVFVMPDSRTWTEKISDSLVIEHVKAFRFPGKWEYRFIWKKSQIKPVLEKYLPQIIEVGSPYILPSRIRAIAKKVCPAAKLLGFWHADFPVTYVERPLKEKFGKILADLGKKIAFAYARSEFKDFAGLEVSNEETRVRIIQNGLKAFELIPLGCNVSLFHPNKRDIPLREELKQGNPERKILFFPHRFCTEKGLDLLLKAYPVLEEKWKTAPAIVFAGTGPMLPEVLSFVKEHKATRYIGFISSEETMAKYHASADFGLALSYHETFGLSILESMASGIPQVAANAGAAMEHVKNSEAGILLEERTPEALAHKIAELFDILKNSDLKTKARTYAEKYSWQACFSKQNHLYHQLTDF